MKQIPMIAYTNIGSQRNLVDNTRFFVFIKNYRKL